MCFLKCFHQDGMKQPLRWVYVETSSYVFVCLFVLLLFVRRIEESSPTQSSVFHFIVVASQFNFMHPLLFVSPRLCFQGVTKHRNKLSFFPSYSSFHLFKRDQGNAEIKKKTRDSERSLHNLLLHHKCTIRFQRISRDE